MQMYVHLEQIYVFVCKIYVYLEQIYIFECKIIVIVIVFIFVKTDIGVENRSNLFGLEKMQEKLINIKSHNTAASRTLQRRKLQQQHAQLVCGAQQFMKVTKPVLLRDEKQLKYCRN